MPYPGLYGSLFVKYMFPEELEEMLPDISKEYYYSHTQSLSQGLSYYRPLGRARRDPGGGKMRDPGNEVVHIHSTKGNSDRPFFTINGILKICINTATNR